MRNSKKLSPTSTRSPQGLTKPSPAPNEIELISEYRTRLISDVVTGQVDVRGIEIPEIADEELSALDEGGGNADDMIDDEVETEVAE